MKSRTRKQNERLCFTGILIISFFAGIPQGSFLWAEDGQAPFPQLELKSFPDTTQHKPKAVLPEITPQNVKESAKLPDLPVINSPSTNKPSTSKLTPNINVVNNQTVKKQAAENTSRTTETMPSELILPVLEKSLLGNNDTNTKRTSSIWNRNEFIVKPTNPVTVTKERKIRSRELASSESRKEQTPFVTADKQVPVTPVPVQNSSSSVSSVPSTNGSISNVSRETPTAVMNKTTPREVLVYSPQMLFAIDLVPENQAPYNIAAQTNPSMTTVPNPVVNTRSVVKQTVPGDTETTTASPLPSLSSILHQTEGQPLPNAQQKSNSPVAVQQQTRPQIENSGIASLAMEFIPQGSETTAVVLREESPVKIAADSPQIINEQERNTEPRSLPPIVLNPNVSTKKSEQVQISSKHNSSEKTWFDSLPQDDFLIGFDDSVGWAQSSDIKEAPQTQEQEEVITDNTADDLILFDQETGQSNQVASATLPAIEPKKEKTNVNPQTSSVQEPKQVQKFAPIQMESEVTDSPKPRKSLGDYFGFLTLKEKKSVTGSSPSHQKKAVPQTSPESVALKSDKKTSKPIFGITKPVKGQKNENETVQVQAKPNRKSTQTTAPKEESSKRSVAQIFNSLNPFDKSDTRK